MDKAEAGDVIIESIKLALEKIEGKELNSLSRQTLIESIRDELIVLREFGATVSYNTEATAAALAEFSLLWLFPLDETVDPHLVMRRLPDAVLDQMLANAPGPSIREQTPFRMVHAERLFRKGELDDDWEWVLTGPSSGRVEFSMKSPDGIRIDYIAREDAKDWSDMDDLMEIERSEDPPS